MTSFELPAYPELFDNTFTSDQKQALMTLGAGPDREIEMFILRVMTYGVINKCSDVSFHLIERSSGTKARINIRTPERRINFYYEGGGRVEHFKTKLLSLMKAAQGGSSSVTMKGSFALEYPAEWAVRMGLRPHAGDDTYYVNNRVQFAKAFDGVSFVIRLVDDQNSPDLPNTGLNLGSLALAYSTIHRSSGLIICTGPTGCGKSTLLHAMVKHLNDGTRSISTAENPIEFRLRGHGQIIQLEIGGDMTYERASESFMRQHPDVIVYAEILNHHIATVCMQLAQTGHLVFATIHTDDSVQAPSRLIGMFPQDQRDWAASTLGSVLKMVLAPRLLPRRNKNEQQAFRQPTRKEREWFKENGLVVPSVIPENKAERKGIVPVVEALEVNYEVAKAIHEGAAPDVIYKEAIKQPHFETLAMSAARAIESGVCTVEDCSSLVPINFVAEKCPSIRTQLATKYNFSYSELNTLLDGHVSVDRDESLPEDLDIEQILQEQLAQQEQRSAA
ncbi:ATPase, T2SS/T4P/T4SS family [Herbaspirillum sp.]|uniref:ATPase, T2SS/T4P/T4SS family n=1 Tax=Herbaspirillum sp. TaxID=1890675 RepID=UPI000C0B256F|nr:ATPase, T2SS/T4P/T4SS family [Herbaspirillum sp.]MAF04704.1 hypothetical protein [Herbaspirillum sp.]|tara:strand:- start:18022 stop:19533 length:1512 start_codon:yes stop_codon:yes gene_type:complete